MIFTCIVWPCPTMQGRTRMRSRCWSMSWKTDPNYAPAWEELGLRSYYDADYSNGGEKMFQRSNQASERAVGA